MTGNRRLTVEILGDAIGLGRALTDADGALGRFGSGVGRAALVAGTALVGAGALAVSVAPDILAAGTAIDVLNNKADTVFGESVGQVRGWAEANAAAMGLTANQATGLAAGIGDLLVPMGMSRGAAADMSAEMLDTAAALSAWTGGQRDVADVAGIITDAILGETDALKGLGIDLSAAEVQARALANAQAEGRSEATQTDAALATQQLILERSADAQTAWANGSMGALQAQNQLRAAWNEGKEALIMGLTPALQAGVQFLVDRVIPGVRQVIDIFREDGFGGALDFVAGKAREAWPAIEDAIVTGAQRVGQFVVDYAPVLAGQLADWALEFVRWIGPMIPPALAELARLGGALANWVIDDGLPMLAEKLTELGGQFVAWVGPQIPPMLVELATLLLALTGWVITDAVPSLLGVAVDLGLALISWIPPLGLAMVTGLGQVFTQVVWPWLSGLPGRAADAIGDVAGTLVDKGMDLIRGIGTGLVNQWFFTGLWLLGLPGRAVDTIGDLAMTLFGAGRDLIQGLWDGMRDVMEDVTGWVRGIGEGILGEVTDVFDIGSPSRKMAELGRYVGEGFALGLAETMPTSIDAPALPSIDPALLAAAGGSAGLRAAGAGMPHINLTVRIGERDITDIVDARLDDADAELAAAVSAGHRP